MSMFQPPRNRKLPYLSQYVDYQLRSCIQRRKTIWKSKWFFIAIAGASLMSLVALKFFGGIAFLMAPLIWAGSIGGLIVGDHLLRQNQSEEDFRLTQIIQALFTYSRSIEERKLHKELDYTAAQLLETSAYYWVRIQETLSESLWCGPTASMQLRALRAEILDAANDSMDHAMMLCQRTFAPKGQVQNGLKDFIEDMTNLDLDNLLEGFRSSFKNKKAYHSDRLPEVGEPVRQIAAKLGRLMEQVTSMSSDAAARQLAGENPISKLDEALHTISEIRNAEKEIRDFERERLGPF